MSESAKEGLIVLLMQQGWKNAREYVETCSERELYDMALSMLIVGDCEITEVWS